MSKLARVTISMPRELYEAFLQKLYKEHGKTHGGLISRTIRELIKEHYLGEEKEGVDILDKKVNGEKSIVDP